MKNRVVTTAIAEVLVDAGCLVTVAVFPTLAIAMNPDLLLIWLDSRSWFGSRFPAVGTSFPKRPADHIVFHAVHSSQRHVPGLSESAKVKL
jgi:hypothetical protein